MNKKILFITGLILLAIIFTAFYFYKPAATTSVKYDDFAKCLASKNITMYGTKGCSHCQNEKRAFGDSFKYVPYVECTAEPQKCVDKDVQTVPTWIFPDGKKLIGEQGVEKLSQESGCPLLSK